MTDTPLPRGWAAVQLGDILLAIIGGGTPSRKVPDYFNGAIPWFTVKDMHSLRPSDAEEHISEVAVRDSATNVIPPNTLIIATRIALGKAIKPTVACAINQDLKALIVGRGIDSDFLLYWVTSNAKAIQDLGSGTTVSGIRLETLNTLCLNLPPSAEQTRIVAKLEELLSDLDAGVAELKAAQKKLTLYRQSLLKAAVEGTLTAEWRAAQAKRGEPLETGAQLLERILIERRRRWEEKQLAKFKEQGKIPPKDWRDKYPEPVKPNTAGLPELPEGWVWATVEQLGYVQLGRQRSPSKLTGRNPVKYIRAANITDSGINFSDVLEMDFTEAEVETFRLKPGDILLTEASGSPQHVGRPVIWPSVEGLYCFQNTVIRFKPLLIGSEFYFRLFQAWQTLGKFIEIAGGVGINHLSAGKFSSIVAPLPPLVEQQMIVEALSTTLNELIQKEKIIEKGLQQAGAQRQNILKAAFSGQLVPQDPNDEPASVLLEHIRAERAEREKQPKTRKIKANKEMTTVVSKLIDVLAEAGDWVPAQEAFRRCGVADGAQTDQIEALYAELRELDKSKRLAVELVTDAQGRKLYDRLKLVATA